MGLNRHLGERCPVGLNRRCVIMLCCAFSVLRTYVAATFTLFPTHVFANGRCRYKTVQKQG